MLVSAVQRSESAICIHISSPSWTSLLPPPSHPSRSSQSTELSSLCNADIKKEQNWIICRDVDGPRVCHTEWSKSEREKQISYINSYMWNLDKWYRWTYLQGRNRDTDVEKRHVDTGRGGRGGMNWEIGIEVCALPYVKQIYFSYRSQYRSDHGHFLSFSDTLISYM